ncbi:MAG TPA: DUF4126 family protein [Chthoniobacterales bacterium]|nr:DUF4126 family protein [Chthoniobacterales bacterium]
MNPNYVYAVAIGIGVVAGLRSLLAPAAVAWAVCLGWLHLQGTSLGFVESKVALIIFSLLAIGELGADLLPQTPKRTDLVPLLVRMVTGGFCGACLCASANRSLAIGTMLGAAGGLIGAFAGYEVRRRLVSKLNIRDYFVALSEDLVAVGLAWFFLSR